MRTRSPEIARGLTTELLHGRAGTAIPTNGHARPAEERAVIPTVTHLPVPVGRAPRRRRRLEPVVVAALDVAMATAVGVLLGLAGGWIALYVALVVAVGSAQDVYARRIAADLYSIVPSGLVQAAVPILVLSPVAAVLGAPTALWWLPLLAGIAIVTGRLLATGVLRASRRRGHLRERAIIVGVGERGQSLCGALQEHPEYGVDVVGYLDEFDEVTDPPIVGRVSDLDAVLRTHVIDRVLIAFGATREPEMVEVLRACDAHHVEVQIVPRFFELGVAPRSADCEDVWGIPLYRLRRSALRRSARVVKRTFDVVSATAGIVLLSPIMAIAAILVKVDSPGPVLFRQRRVGRNGEMFDVLKFRSMPENDDSDTTWNVENDERLSAIGRFLRRTSIDELPQLFNVLRGDMSIVGPRPERQYFTTQFAAEVRNYDDRHRLRGGITGWAQIHNLRGDTSIEERTRFDNYYIEHWSLWRDIVTVLRTVRAMFQGPPS